MTTTTATIAAFDATRDTMHRKASTTTTTTTGVQTAAATVAEAALHPHHRHHYNYSKSLSSVSSSSSDLKLFIRDISSNCSNTSKGGGGGGIVGQKWTIHVHPWSTIQEVKNKVQQMIHIPQNLQSLYFKTPSSTRFTVRKELPNHRRLNDAGIYNSGETLLLDIKKTKTSSSSASSSSSGLLLSPTLLSPLSSTQSIRMLKNNNVNPSTMIMSPTVQGSSTLTLLSSSSGYGNTNSHSGASNNAAATAASSDIYIPSATMIECTPKCLKKLIQHARRGFLCGIKPSLTLDGSGGTYYLHDARKTKIAVYKPADEEPYAINNPRGYLPPQQKQPHKHKHKHHPESPSTTSPSSLRKGITPGQSCIREVAAYLLDHNSFSGVPMTTLVNVYHPTAFHYNNTDEYDMDHHHHKLGSFQEFFQSDCTMDDISPSMISVQEVHKIAILDIRLLNADRNAANILCRKKQQQRNTPKDNTNSSSSSSSSIEYELIPIDHGYCLRDVADISWMDWCWLDWPQLKEPMSEKTKEYIYNLDIEKDVQVLKQYCCDSDSDNMISMDAINYFRASSRILKAGTKIGLSLYDIANMCCRNDYDYNTDTEMPSKLEKLYSMANDLSSLAIVNGRYNHILASNALVEQLSPPPSLSRKNNNTLRRSCTISCSSSSTNNDSSSSRLNKLLSSYSDDNCVSDGDYGDKDISSSSFSYPLPEMVQSSSGSSSEKENGNDNDNDAVNNNNFTETTMTKEKEDCKEWAATVITDSTVIMSTSSSKKHNNNGKKKERKRGSNHWRKRSTSRKFTSEQEAKDSGSDDSCSRSSSSSSTSSSSSGTNPRHRDNNQKPKRKFWYKRPGSPLVSQSNNNDTLDGGDAADDDLSVSSSSSSWSSSSSESSCSSSNSVGQHCSPSLHKETPSSLSMNRAISVSYSKNDDELDLFHNDNSYDYDNNKSNSKERDSIMIPSFAPLPSTITTMPNNNKTMVKKSVLSRRSTYSSLGSCTNNINSGNVDNELVMNKSMNTNKSLSNMDATSLHNNNSNTVKDVLSLSVFDKNVDSRNKKTSCIRSHPKKELYVQENEYNDYYHDYFLKFIDLTIMREIKYVHNNKQKP